MKKKLKNLKPVKMESKEVGCESDNIFCCVGCGDMCDRDSISEDGYCEDCEGSPIVYDI